MVKHKAMRYSTFSLLGRLLAILCCALVLGLNVQGQDAAMKVRKAKPYRIANTDRLRIGIVQEDNLNAIARVDAKGCVNLTYVGEVYLAGLTISEAEKAVENAYREGRFLRNPQVTINVEEYAPREVSISGEVRNGGRYPLPVETVMTVLDLVLKAGGFNDTAKGTEVKITRFLPDGRVAKVFVVNVESIIKGKGKNRDNPDDTSLELEPGDVVFVPQRII